MDNQGWIKLHRSILDSAPLFGKAHDFTIFVYLLLKADRKTGDVKIGRLRLARLFRVKQSTIYMVIKRLANENYINIKSNNQFSIVHICNYDKYQNQSNNETNNKVTTNENESNTIQEVRIKNKEKNTYSSLSSLDEETIGEVATQYSVSTYSVTSLAEDLRLYCQSKGKRYSNYRAALQNWVRRALETKRISKLPPQTPVQDDPQFDPEVAKINLQKIKEIRDGIVRSKSM